MIHSLLQEIEKTQQELISAAYNITDDVAFEDFINNFVEKTKSFSTKLKLDLILQICTICPAFPGNKPPYLEKTDSFTFARHALDYQNRNKLKRKIVLLSLGISDGARIYQNMLFSRILGVNFRLIGVDYSQKYLDESRHLFPDQEFICLDLFNLKKGSETYKRLKNKVDFIDASFVLHEIYSFSNTTVTGKIDDEQGKQKVIELLKTCYDLLRKNGEIFIKDGYILDDADNTTTIKFSNLYRNAYDIFAKQYEPISYPTFDEGADNMKMSRQKLAIALDKMTFLLRLRRRRVTSERIAREMKELLCFLTEESYCKYLENAGFNVTYKRKFNQEVYEASQKIHVDILDENKKLPQPYLTLIGVKKTV